MHVGLVFSLKKHYRNVLFKQAAFKTSYCSSLSPLESFLKCHGQEVSVACEALGAHHRYCLVLPKNIHRRLARACRPPRSFARFSARLPSPLRSHPAIPISPLLLLLSPASTADLGKRGTRSERYRHSWKNQAQRNGLAEELQLVTGAFLFCFFGH